MRVFIFKKKIENYFKQKINKLSKNIKEVIINKKYRKMEEIKKKYSNILVIKID